MDAGGLRGTRFGRLPTVRPATGTHASSSTSSRRLVDAAEAATPVDPDPPRDQDPQLPATQPEAPEDAPILLQAVDARTGRLLWQIPGDRLPALSEEILRASAGAGAASFRDMLLETSDEPFPGDSVERRLGARAYSAEEHAAAPRGKVSRTI